MTKKERVKQFGLVGKNIDYSFSRTYFKDKFERENKVGYHYANFDLQSIENIREVFNSGATPSGLNVTIPYKKAVIPETLMMPQKNTNNKWSFSATGRAKLSANPRLNPSKRVIKVVVFQVFTCPKTR